MVAVEMVGGAVGNCLALRRGALRLEERGYATLEECSAAATQEELTFDKFHVMKIINEALDEVRRQEKELHPELKDTRYLWLKNLQNLNASQNRLLEEFLDCHRYLETRITESLYKKVDFFSIMV